MSQLLLDEHINVRQVLPLLRKWITAQLLIDLRPNERIPDERVPEILRTLKQPTFVTIDQGFWDRDLCHPSYGILYFALRSEEQGLIPDLLRALLRRPDFHTRARRMGKVARISPSSIDYWQFQVQDLQRLAWQGAPRRKR
jgi:hypothetical protein